MPTVPLTPDQRKQKIIDESTEMKKKADALFEQQRMQKAEEVWNGYRSNSYAAWKDYVEKLNRKCMGKDQSGKLVPRWDLVKHEIEKASHLEQNSYHDWKSAMMSILSMCSILNGAIVSSLNHYIASSILDELVVSNPSLNNKGYFVPTLSDIKNMLMKKISGGGDAEFNLPLLVHSLKMDENNKINYTPLKGFDDTSELNSHFKTLVGLWLAEKHGYIPSDAGEGCFIHQDTQQELTSKEFEQFKQQDLDEFLEENTQLKFRHSGP